MNNGKSIEIITKKVFNDAIHGTIELHPLCVEIIDTPQFQRLRNIKQVGASYYVFSSASHNRFEHCIGVCHLAGKLVRALKRRQEELNIDDKDVLCVEIAGLCHDLGHGPFSHLFDKFIEMTRPDVTWRHENASAKMFDYLIKTNDLIKKFNQYGLGEKDLIFIKEMITVVDPISTRKNWNYRGRTEDKSFLYEIVANKRSGVDVDKWDYFLRDGHGLGLKVMFDYSRLVKFSRVIDGQICFREKEEQNLYDMFYVRKTLHRVAYQHKVSKIIDSIEVRKYTEAKGKGQFENITISSPVYRILDAWVLADKHLKFKSENGKILKMSETIDDISSMTHLSDDILTTIYSSDSTHKDMVKARELLHRIYTRQLYVNIGSTVAVTDIKPNVVRESILKRLKTSSSLSSDDIKILWRKLDYGMGKENPIVNVRFFTKNDPDKCIMIRPQDTSKMQPNIFEEKIYMVVCKKNDAKSVAEAKEAFEKACLNDLNISISSRDAWPDNFTPEKNQPEQKKRKGATNQYSETDNTAIKKLKTAD